MNIGWLGLGKLGLPCALVLAHRGHQVTGYDVSDHPRKILEGVEPLPQEKDLDVLAALAHIGLAGSVGDLVVASDVVFVAVQTPHAPAYGGEQPMPPERRDFEYGYLIQAVRDVAAEAERQGKHVTIVVVSTVLPGTFNRHLRSLANRWTTLVYNPFFIAMGTTVDDFNNPEFVLVGADREADWKPLADIYRQVHNRPLRVMSIESAELAKVAYNTFISAKIVFANTLMEVCHKTGADCDAVTEVLAAATRRVCSPAYLSGGMGDGGACHPRDLIAMSWLAQRLDLSTDLMGYLANAREAQTGWLADLVEQWAAQTGLPVVLLGKAYKPESDLTAGSPALLLAGMLRARGLDVAHGDPYSNDLWVPEQAVFVVGTKHALFGQLEFGSGSVVLDPFGYIPDRPGVTVVRIGRKW
jgi:UDPglucose 6-dehydrogenase